MADIYYDLKRFVDWVRTSLTTNLGPRVSLHAFATTDFNGAPLADRAAKYFHGTNRIFLGRKLSGVDARDDDSDACPENCEWHEYTHHLDHINRGVCELIESEGDQNHGGYANSSTCDSVDEGIASFLPTMFDRDPDYAGGSANLEDKISAWYVNAGDDTSRIWSIEDYAVSALLWDLVDDNVDSMNTSAITPGLGRLHVPVSYVDDVTMPLTDLWQLLGSEQPSTVRDLQQLLDARNTAPLIDLDNDGIQDVNRFDPLFPDARVLSGDARFGGQTLALRHRQGPRRRRGHEWRRRALEPLRVPLVQPVGPRPPVSGERAER
jgi:hypothetical protein